MSGKHQIRQGRRRAKWRGRSRWKRMVYGTEWKGEQRRNWKRLRNILFLFFILVALSAVTMAVR